MSIQPGAGFSFASSSYGTTLDINQPWTPPLGDSNPVQQFETIIAEQGATAKIMVGKGAAIISGPGQARGDGMKEWYINTFSVFPDGARTTGTDTKSQYVSQGGTVTIKNSSVEGGSDTWYVSLVANNYQASNPDSAYPMLAVMAAGSDAYNKTTPFDGNGDSRYFGQATTLMSVNVVQPDSSVVSGYLFVSSTAYQQNYNCQRITVARIDWDVPTSAWIVRQYIYGPVTFTDDVKLGANITREDGDPLPTIAYATEQTAWEGAWTGYTKDFGSDTLLPI